MFKKIVSHLLTESNAASDAVIFNNFDTSQGFSAGANATTSYNSSGQNIKLTTSVSGDPGNANQCVKVVPQTGASVDASMFANFTFWIDDTQGNNTVKVTMVDTSNALWSGWTTAAVQNTWGGISLPMSSVTGINKGAIKEIRIGEWNKGTYYVDGLQFDTPINAASGGKTIIQELTSVFENSTAVLQYTYVENINDGRGYTFGFPGFCSGTYDGTEFLKEYQRLNSNNTLVKYIPTFEKIDAMPHPDGKCSNVQGLENFPKDFKSCGNDPAFEQAQQNIVDKDYWNPSQNLANEIGAKYLITKGELYDTFINHGEDGANDIMNSTTQAMGGSPASGIDEKSWLNKFLQTRLKVLQADPTWADAVDRVKVYQNLLNQGNVNLNTPMTIQCYGDTFTIT
jgi:hypothetical protein